MRDQSMKEHSPFFSIIMPTRDRGSLLRYSLQSALDQTFQDYEIIVSNNFSSDKTEEVVRQTSGDRVRYFRTEKALPMHQSWEFALEKARGQWILFLCDDDALFPQALERVFETIQNSQASIVSWDAGMYYLQGCATPGWRGQVELHQGTGQDLEIPTRDHLRELFEFAVPSDLAPRFQGSFVRRALIENVKRQLGRFFLPPCPDFTAWSAVLAKTDRFIFIDRDLEMVGEGSHLVEVSPSYGEISQHANFSEDYGPDRMFEYVPLGQMTYGNWVAESLLRVQHAMPAELSAHKINWERYFVACYMDLCALRSRGLDVSNVEKSYFEALAKQPLAFQARVRARLMRLRAGLFRQRPGVRKWVVRLRLPQFAERFLRKRKQTAIRGDKTFQNILEAVHHASGLQVAG